MRVHRTIERPMIHGLCICRFADRKSLTVHAMPTPQHGDALWWRAPGLKESRDRGIERCLRHSPTRTKLLFILVAPKSKEGTVLPATGSSPFTPGARNVAAFDLRSCIAACTSSAGPANTRAGN